MQFSPLFAFKTHQYLLEQGSTGALGSAGGLAAAAGPGVAQCAAQPLIMLLYTNEFNSLFMLNRVLLRLLGCRATGADRLRVLAYRANLVGFWLSFAWGRVWMSGQGVVASSSLYGERPVLAVVGTAFGVLFLAMNIGGGVLVWMRESAEYKGAQQETPLWMLESRTDDEVAASDAKAKIRGTRSRSRSRSNSGAGKRPDRSPSAGPRPNSGAGKGSARSPSAGAAPRRRRSRSTPKAR